MVITGKSIKELRELGNLTQKQVIDEYKKRGNKMDKGLYSKIENGYALPTPELLQCVLTLSDVELDKTHTVANKNKTGRVATSNRTIETNGKLNRDKNVILQHLIRDEGDGLRWRTDLDERRIRQCVHELRKEGHDIVAFHDGKGYKLSNDITEVHRFVKQEMARAASVVEPLNNMINRCRLRGYEV